MGKKGNNAGTMARLLLTEQPDPGRKEGRKQGTNDESCSFIVYFHSEVMRSHSTTAIQVTSVDTPLAASLLLYKSPSANNIKGSVKAEPGKAPTTAQDPR